MVHVAREDYYDPQLARQISPMGEQFMTGLSILPRSQCINNLRYKISQRYRDWYQFVTGLTGGFMLIP